MIEAKIDDANGWLSSHELENSFLLGIHNEAVKSMRYPPDDTYKRRKEKKDGKQEEETIDEHIKEFEDGMDAKELV
eukprot:gene30584-34716_t